VAQGHGERVLAATVTLEVLQTLGQNFRWGDSTRFGDIGKVFS
jgi:hypothetical protein